MEEYVSNIEELTLNISNENDFLKKILIINKLKKITNNLNNYINEYKYLIENKICMLCDHEFEDYFEKYERTKKQCIKCNMIQY